MENNLMESVAIEKTVAASEVPAILELNELSLTYVGGGIAELVGV